VLVDVYIHTHIYMYDCIDLQKYDRGNNKILILLSLSDRISSFLTRVSNCKK
jgi:hypothetical protein